MVIKEVKAKQTEFVLKEGKSNHSDFSETHKHIWKNFKEYGYNRNERIEGLERYRKKKQEEDKSKKWLEE